MIMAESKLFMFPAREYGCQTLCSTTSRFFEHLSTNIGLAMKLTRENKKISLVILKFSIFYDL